MPEHQQKETKPVISPPKKAPLLQKFAIIILAILSISGFILRNNGFHHRHMLTFDEELYTYLGLQLKENPLNYDPQPVKRHLDSLIPGRRHPSYTRYMKEPLFKHPPLFPWLLSLSYFLKLKPFPYMSAIMVPMLLGLLNIVFVFWLGKMLYDYRVGLLAAFFLTVDPIHWICSEKIWMETTLALFIFLALFFFVLGWEQSRYLLLSGLFAGFALLTKYAGISVLVLIFLFALFYKEELLFKRNFWLIFVIALAVFSPWLIWNYSVYGGPFLKNIFVAHRELGKFQKYNNIILLSSAACAYLLILRLLAPKFIPPIRKAISTLFKAIKFLLPVAIVAAFIMMLFCRPFPQAFKNMLIYNYLPSTGWDVGIFWKESWCFYFGRLLELSPTYLFAFLALIFFSFKSGRRESLLIFSAFLMLFFLVFWKNYQSRYLLFVVPILLILASRLQIWIWDRLKTQPQTLKIRISSLAFLGLVGYFIIKTINVGIHLALPNKVCYF